MSESQAAQPRSRRALLAGALGGLGAVVASAVGRASPVRAEGEAMVVGGDYNDATSATILSNSTTGATVFLGQSTAGGIGVYGYSNSNVGTKGESPSGTAIFGTSASGIGVSGTSSTWTGVSGTSTSGRGVVGESESAAGVEGTTSSYIGVYGIASSGDGVFGQSNTGIGVYGYTNAPDDAAVRTRNPGNGTGVIGVSGNLEPAAKAKTGVYGHAQQDNTSRGVWGISPAGHGIHGESDTGWAGFFDGKVFTNSFMELREIANPSAPGTDRARLFVRDNGSGRTQLCVRFHNGTIRVLATA
jgi:hypothetical protein